MKTPLALLIPILVLLLSSCRPKDSGAWAEDGVYWTRRWGTGIVGAFSTISIFRTDSQGTVEGPHVGSNDILIKRQRGAGGEIEYVFYSGTAHVVYRLDTDPANRLKPFVMTKREDHDRFNIFYDWAGTEAAVVKDEDAQTASERPGSAQQR
jgi:hypothetical protein